MGLEAVSTVGVETREDACVCCGGSVKSGSAFKATEVRLFSVSRCRSGIIACPWLHQTIRDRACRGTRVLHCLASKRHMRAPALCKQEAHACCNAWQATGTSMLQRLASNPF